LRPLTTLTLATNTRPRAELAWSGSSGGISTSEPLPVWQPAYTADGSPSRVYVPPVTTQVWVPPVTSQVYVPAVTNKVYFPPVTTVTYKRVATTEKVQVGRQALEHQTLAFREQFLSLLWQARVSTSQSSSMRAWWAE
jgi:hypothetical protein